MIDRSVSLEGTMKRWSSLSSAVGLLFLLSLNGVTLIPQDPETSISSRTDNWSAACGKEPKIITIPKNIKKYLLLRHNTIRDIVASGTFLQLPPAGRMCKMSWDNDLADAAKLLVKRCDLRPTRFPAPGHNAIYYMFPRKQNAFWILRSQLDAWYDQYKFIQPLDILDGSSLNRSEGGDFLRMIVGPSNRLGCAMAETDKHGWIFQWLICLYSCSPKNNTVLYEFAPRPGNFCTTGLDGKFQHLCSDQEVVDNCKLAPLFTKVISNNTALQIKSRSWNWPYNWNWWPYHGYPGYNGYPNYGYPHYWNHWYG